jgi:hypothetical protein
MGDDDDWKIELPNIVNFIGVHWIAPTTLHKLVSRGDILLTLIYKVIRTPFKEESLASLWKFFNHEVP